MPQPQDRGIFDRLYRFLFGVNLIQEELRETEDLYWRVAQLHRKSQFADGTGQFNMACGICATFIESVPAGLTGDFLAAVSEIVSLEKTIFTLPEIEDFKRLSMKEGMELRNFLRSKEWFHLNEEKALTRLGGCLCAIFGKIAETIPDISVPSPFTIPVIYTLPEPRQYIDTIIGTLHEERYVDADLFAALRRRLQTNLYAVSDLAPGSNKPFKTASKNDAPLDEIVDAYLGGTPFAGFFASPVPLKLTHEERFQHCHIVGGSGSGKTQLLQSLILHDLRSEDPPALVIVDSQGDLIDKVSRLEGIEDRLILITPKEIEHPPALNIFEIDRRRLGTYDALTKEQVTAGAIETFDYLFTGLLGADLTAKQGVFFRYVARLMLSLPETLGRNATILDMIRLMSEVEPYRKAIEALPPIQREFFTRDFEANTFEQTKEQIRYRLQGIIENPTIAALFTSPSTKVDLFTALNNGAVVLVDTAKDLLKGASSHFGRIFIALTLQAVLERAAIPEDRRRSAFLVVDEAAEYFDQNIDDMLAQVRKYKLGCCFAHQHLDQCTPQLRASFAANTGIKMASGVSSSDARALAPDMRTTPDFILSQPRLQFACHIRGVTPQAVAIPIEAGKLEREDRMSDTAYDEMRKRNRGRVSIERSEPPEAPQAQEQASRPQGPPEPKPPPRSQRPRPKKHRKRPGPLAGDIDTAAK